MCAKATRCLNGCKSKHSSVSADELEELDAEREIRLNLMKAFLLPPLAPHLPMRNNFERLMKVLLWYTGITLPLVAAFRIDYHPAHGVIDYIVDIFFWIDILMTLRTTFYDNDMNLITDTKVIFNKYASFRLPIDVIANFPWELFALAAGYPFDEHVFASWRLIRMLRFFRIVKVHKPILVDVNDSGARRLVLYFPLMTHWTACIWWTVGYGEYLDGYINRPPYQGGSAWLVRTPGSVAMDTASQRLGSTSSLGQNYLSSLYWASTTLMKAAWVHPSTISEKCFGAFVVLLGAIMFAVILGQINGIIRKIDESTVQRRNKLGTFKQFCTLNNVGPALEKKILAYALAEWNVTSGVSIAGAFGAAKLSPILRSSLIAEIHKDLLSTSGFFTRVSVGCAKQLLMKASTQVCLKNELLVGYGQMARELFIMIKGSLQISIPANVRKQSSKGGDDSNRKSVSKKQVMQFRILDRMGGITGMWRPGDNACPFPFEVLAKEFSTMLNISRVGMMEVLNNVSNVDRNEAFEMLQEEHEKTISALKMGGKRAPNARASKASSRPSEQENTEPAPPPAGEPDLTRSRDPILIAKDKLETLQETVTNVGVVLSTTKASASTLRDIYENISGTTTDRSGQETARSDGNGASSFDIKDAARTRAQERAEIMDKKRREAVESTEEKQQITKTSTDNNANLITSAMVL